MTTTETTVSCRKEDVLSFRKLGSMPYPDYLTCPVFGEGDEIHLAHQLAARPDWDEAVTITTKQPVDPATLKKVPALVIEAIKDPNGDITGAGAASGIRRPARPA
ncbi:hypothetical protein K9S39_38825 [Streptomyces halobius]|uniref:Uncharacterized protein n=1 Tax=Streptomyces halobius TaxID=2879846 RepID=A0ABY4MGW2_9ACTN|nr:hypothetical protein K9S39_38825 [Streptomyces halobius]